MDWKCVDGFNVRVSSELRENAGIDSGGDTVVSSLHSVKRFGSLTEVAEMREHTLLCSPDPHHLCARCALSGCTFLRVGSTVTPIAQSLRIDRRRRSIEQLDHHVDFACFRKFILRLELADGFGVCVL